MVLHGHGDKNDPSPGKQGGHLDGILKWEGQLRRWQRWSHQIHVNSLSHGDIMDEWRVIHLALPGILESTIARLPIKAATVWWRGSVSLSTVILKDHMKLTCMESNHWFSLFTLISSNSPGSQAGDFCITFSQYFKRRCWDLQLTKHVLSPYDLMTVSHFCTGFRWECGSISPQSCGTLW